MRKIRPYIIRALPVLLVLVLAAAAAYAALRTTVKITMNNPNTSGTTYGVFVYENPDRRGFMRIADVRTKDPGTSVLETTGRQFRRTDNIWAALYRYSPEKQRLPVLRRDGTVWTDRRGRERLRWTHWVYVTHQSANFAADPTVQFVFDIPVEGTDPDPDPTPAVAYIHLENGDATHWAWAWVNRSGTGDDAQGGFAGQPNGLGVTLTVPANVPIDIVARFYDDSNSEAGDDRRYSSPGIFGPKTLAANEHWTVVFNNLGTGQ